MREAGAEAAQGHLALLLALLDPLASALGSFIGAFGLDFMSALEIINRTRAAFDQ